MSVINVANQAQLAAALSTAVGGETFVLAPGSYGSVSISGRNFSAPITIQSQSSTSMATFSNLDVRNSSNIAFKSVDIGRAMAANEYDYGKMASVFSSKNVSFDAVKIHGTLDGNPRNDGWGLYVADSANVRVANSDFTELHRGAVFERSSNLTVEANKVHGIRSDGLDFTAVDTVLLKDNQLRDFFPVADDHADAIQFWSQGQTRGSSNITITGNQIFQGSGLGMQGMHLRDEVGTNPFKNVNIYNNILYGNDMWNGIHVNHGQGVSITNNTVVSRTNDGGSYWIRVEQGSDITIQKNVTDTIITKSNTGSINVSGNLELNGDSSAQAMVPNLNKNAATTIADLLVSGYGYQAGSMPAPSPTPTPSPSPSPAPAPIPTPSPAPTSTSDSLATKTIYGTSAGETIRGTSANETISGVPASGTSLGRDTADKLYGGGGSDLFVLGDHRGSFYMDNTNMWSGRKDYAQILDFGSDDRIQLSGTLSEYVFRRETVNGMVGTSILKDTNHDGRWDNSDELIGHVANVTLSTNSLVFTSASVSQTTPVTIAPAPTPSPAPAPSLPSDPNLGTVSGASYSTQPVKYVPEPLPPVYDHAPVSSSLMSMMFAHHFAIA